MKKVCILILFVLNFIEMVLELTAARSLSPFFGNSQQVWTAIIGVIMLSGAAGNIAGGIISEKVEKNLIPIYFMLAGITIALTFYTDRIDLSFVESSYTVAGTLIASIVLYFAPAFFLSCITPYALKEYVADSDKGKEQGYAHAAIGIGALAGTFFGGFFIIPTLGTKYTVLLLTILAFVSACFVYFITTEKKQPYIVIVSVIICIVLPLTNQNLTNVVAEFDTDYTHIQVLEGTGAYDGKEEDIYVYSSAGAWESGTFLRPSIRNELVYEYTKRYFDVIDESNAKTAMMIGGAGFSVPKYFISHYPEGKMDVIEIDKMAIKIAKKYFFLDELLEEYGTDRLGIYNEDARQFVTKTDKTYDVIMNDAFSGINPVVYLATDEAVKVIKSKLNKDGVYAMNIVGSLEGKQSRFFRSEMKVLEQNFLNVYVVPVVSEDVNEYQNIMVYATDKDYDFDSINYRYLGDEVYMTDDNTSQELFEN